MIRHRPLLLLLLLAAADEYLRNLIPDLLLVEAILDFEFEDSVTNALGITAALPLTRLW